MGKVNLRSRLRENFESEDETNFEKNLVQNEVSSPISSADSQNNVNLRTQLRTNLTETQNKYNSLNQVTEQHEEVISNPRVNLRNTIKVNAVETKVENIETEEFEKEFLPPSIKNTPKTTFVEPEITNIREPEISPRTNIREPKVEKTPSESIFKSDKKDIDRSILKDDKSPQGKNVLDKLNVNKKMLYIALAFAVFSGILIINYLNSFRAEKMFNSELVPVVVLTKDIKEKSVISVKDLEKINIPKKYVLKDAIIVDSKFDSKTLDGKLALTNLYQNEQLLNTRIAEQKDSPWLSPAVPDGNRAFTITTKGLSYIKPTDHVDIFVSIQNPRDITKVINTPILQNALVLAVDGRFKIDSAEPFTGGETVTIAVPNELLSVFSILQENGSFKIALRRDGDTGKLEMKYSPSQIEKMFTDVIEKPIVKVAPKPVVKEVVKVAPKPVVYQRPVYTPPRRTYTPPKPVVQKPKPKPVVQQVKPRPVYVPPKHTTVTVINGTRVNQHDVND